MRFPNFFGLLLFNKPITILPALLAIAFAFIATMVLSPIYEPIIILVTLPLLGAFLIWYLSFLAYFYLLRQDKNLILRGINLYTFQKPVQKAFIVHAVLLGPVALIGWYPNKRCAARLPRRRHPPVVFQAPFRESLEARSSAS